MGEEELDRARAKEAMRISGIESDPFGGAIVEAARLGREGWTPPDPLEAEAAIIMERVGWNWSKGSNAHAAIHLALERGIEIGKAQR